jgi:hydrogenase/urease accessory protein HupE
MNEPNQIMKALREVEGLVLAFIGFMILWAFAALGIRIPFVWNVVLVLILIVGAVVWCKYSKRRGREL